MKNSNEIKNLIDKLKKLKKSANQEEEYLSFKNQLNDSIKNLIIKQKKIEELILHNKRYKIAVQTANLGVWNWNHQEDILHFSSIWLEQLGYKRGELPFLPESWANNVHPDDLENAMQILAEGLNGKNGYFSDEFRMKHKDGSWIWIMGSGRVMELDKSNNPLISYGVNRDITNDKKEEYLLKEMASKDFLTKLGNRLYFYEIFDKELKNSITLSNRTHLALIDIDFFKRFNDNYGHQIGDKILVLLANTLKEVIDVKYVSRIGGEEFGIIFPNHTIKEFVELLKKFQKLLRDFDLKTIHPKLAKEILTVSIGISTIAKGEERKNIFKKADKALYKAKNAGKDKIEIFE